MKPQKILVTINQFIELHRQRGWPTYGALRNIHWRRKALQFEPAFLKVGRRVLIDVDEFWACVERKDKRDKES